MKQYGIVKSVDGERIIFTDNHGHEDSDYLNVTYRSDMNGKGFASAHVIMMAFSPTMAKKWVSILNAYLKDKPYGPVQKRTRSSKK